MPRGDLIQYRRGTTEQWTAANPVLASGEVGYDTEKNDLRIGDGVTAWNSLRSTAVAPGEANGTATLDGAAKLPETQVPDRLSAAELTASFVSAQVGADGSIILSQNGVPL